MWWLVKVLCQVCSGACLLRAPQRSQMAVQLDSVHDLQVKPALLHAWPQA